MTIAYFLHSTVYLGTIAGLTFLLYKLITKLLPIEGRLIHLMLGFICFIVSLLPAGMLFLSVAKVTEITPDGKLTKDVFFTMDYTYTDANGKTAHMVLERGRSYLYNNTDDRLMAYKVVYGEGSDIRILHRYDAHSVDSDSYDFDYTFAKAPKSIRVDAKRKSGYKTIIDKEEDAEKNIREMIETE